MLNILIHLAAYFFALLALCGLGYLGLSSVERMALPGGRGTARRRRGEGYAPAVSILKPLKGTDRQMYESFRSHCVQEYPQYEIIFGVNEASDEAVAEVERLRARVSGARDSACRVYRGDGRNRKMSNLAQMMQRGEIRHIVINDSDIRVEPRLPAADCGADGGCARWEW